MKKSFEKITKGDRFLVTGKTNFRPKWPALGPFITIGGDIEFYSNRYHFILSRQSNPKTILFIKLYYQLFHGDLK